MSQHETQPNQNWEGNKAISIQLQYLKTNTTNPQMKLETELLDNKQLENELIRLSASIAKEASRRKKNSVKQTKLLTLSIFLLNSASYLNSIGTIQLQEPEKVISFSQSLRNTQRIIDRNIFISRVLLSVVPTALVGTGVAMICMLSAGFGVGLIASSFSWGLCLWRLLDCRMERRSKFKKAILSLVEKRQDITFLRENETIPINELPNFFENLTSCMEKISNQPS